MRQNERSDEGELQKLILSWAWSKKGGETKTSKGSAKKGILLWVQYILHKRMSERKANLKARLCIFSSKLQNEVMVLILFCFVFFP